MAPKGKAAKAKKGKEADTKPGVIDDKVDALVSKSETADSSEESKKEKLGKASSSGKVTRGAASDKQHAEVTSSSEKSEATVAESKATSSKASKKRGKPGKESQEQEEEQPSPQKVAKHDVSDDNDSDNSEENPQNGVANPPKKRSRQTEKKSDEPKNKKAKINDAKGGDSKPKLNKTTTDFGDTTFESASLNKDGKEWNFKISSWNVAGLKAWVKKNGLDFIKHEDPDIICLQETKCSEKKLPPEAKVKGYHSYWVSGDKEGYAGLGLLSKQKPIDVKYGIGNKEFDCDGRLITAEFDKFYLVAVYVPNAGQKLKTLPRRMVWDPLFRAHLKKLDEKKPVILCGDMNVAHNEIDLANPKTNTRSAGFTQEERDGLTALLKEGFVDTFRHLYPEKAEAYTFWTYLSNARSRNKGWRLDYFILSERLLPSVCDNVIRNQVFGSDHCPITLFLHI